MAQKLPVINYNRTSVQSLGRHDIYGPYKAEMAKLRGIDAGLGFAKNVTDIIESIDTDKAAVVSSEMTEAMAELNARIKATKMWSSDQLDEMGVDYQSTETALNDNGVQEEYFRDSIPAYEVAEDIYKSQSEAIKQTALSKVTGKGAEIVERTYGSLYKQGIDDAVLHQIKHAQDAEKIRMLGSFESHANNGSYVAAMMVADAAYSNGVWTADEFYGYTKDLPDRVKTNQYMKALDLTKDTPELDDLQYDILVDPDLKNSSKRNLYSMFESKINGIDKITERARKERQTSESATKVVRLSDQLAKTSKPFSLPELQSVVGTLTPGDKKLIATLNANLHNTTSQEALRRLTKQVHTISLPTPGVSRETKRTAVVAKLTEALENNELAPNDFSRLYKNINSATSFGYDNPDVERVVDIIYRQITGGSKDIISNALAEGGVHMLSATEAEWDLLQAVREQGTGLNPWTWWKENRTKYYVESTVENIDEMSRQRNNGTVITKPGSVYEIDMDKTIKALQQKEAAGEMSREEMDKELNKAKSSSDRINKFFKMDPKLKEQFSQ